MAHGKASALWSAYVCLVLLILAADEFEDIAVRDQLQLCLKRERPRVVCRILESHLQIHMPEIPAAIALRDVHRFAPQMAGSIEPALIVKTDCFDGQRVALPFAHRVPHPGRLWIVREASPVRVNL